MTGRSHGIERDGKTGPSRWLMAAGLAAGLSALAVLAHIGRVAETRVAGAVPALAAIGPGKIGQLRAIQLDQGGAAPAGTERLGREALAAAPLAFEPFLAVASAGFRSKAATGSAADARLLREALHRNPRSREARYYLLRYEIGSGNLKGAVTQIAVLNRLNGGVTEQLMTGLGAAIRSEKQVDEAVGALSPHPELLESFLRGFASRPKPAELSVRLVQQLPRPGFANPRVRGAAARLLIQAQAFSEARALWGEWLTGKGPVHSPDFSDRKAPPPFNWELRTDETGVAERDAAGGVAIDYFGRVPGPLVSQLITLPAGNYRARLEYRTIGGTPGATSLSLTCGGSGTRLFEQPITGDSGVDQVLLVRFAVPQGCKGQILGIGGRVQPSRDSQQLHVRKLEVLEGPGR